MIPRSAKTVSNEVQASERLNQSCFCITLDRDALCGALEREANDPGFCRAHVQPRHNLFSNVPVFLAASDILAMKRVAAAIHEISGLPVYQQQVLSWAPAIAHADHGPAGAFMGYDFHLDEQGARLIEVNTNAGGAFLNALLARAQQACCAEMERAPDLPGAADFNAAAVTMFEAEWKLAGKGRPLARIAIVDDEPDKQFLYPEFILARQVLKQAGIDAVIADPASLELSPHGLLHQGDVIDLVYNRLVDFALAMPEHEALRRAYESGAVAVTPNPRNHALLADKRNLILLSDPAALAAMNVPAGLREALRAVPRTVLVTPASADDLWQKRKHLFFKPASGHGSKAVYRGDKLTRGVWQEIVEGTYVAQEFATPGERRMLVDGVETSRKMDVRLYAYGRETLLIAARLYQGQATNFRTPGGGFAPVFEIGAVERGICKAGC